MKTKDKGNIGEAKVAADLLSRGYSIAHPVGDNLPFDLVLFTETFDFKKIQVKYSKARPGGHLEFKTISTTENTKRRFIRRYSPGQVDIFAIYCPDTDEVYYVPAEEVIAHSSSFRLKIGEAKNNQKKGIRFCKYYKEVPI